ncbi:MAG: redoxin family protein [Bryobacteraceae bacterium]
MKPKFLLFLPLFAALASAGVIEDVREAIAKSGDAAAIQKLQAYRTSQGVTAEYLEAFSWLARAQYAAKRYPQAAQTAEEVYDLCLAELKKRPLDREKHLPIALGASVEVQANSMAQQGRRAEAVSYLQDEVKKYAGTSIQTRIQKNLLLLTLEGKPAPALEGVTLPKGKPAVIFFWAHWCPDCKAEAPILKRIRAEYGPKGLTVIAPTQKYGYTVRGEDASPATEVAYIEQIRKQYYEGVIDGPAPVSEANFVRYGASTTPTMVLVDRTGMVRVYHPGAMKYEELQQAIEKLM